MKLRLLLEDWEVRVDTEGIEDLVAEVDTEGIKDLVAEAKNKEEMVGSTIQDRVIRLLLEGEVDLEERETMDMEEGWEEVDGKVMEEVEETMASTIQD